MNVWIINIFFVKNVVCHLEGMKLKGVTSYLLILYE